MERKKLSSDDLKAVWNKMKEMSVPQTDLVSIATDESGVPKIPGIMIAGQKPAAASWEDCYDLKQEVEQAPALYVSCEVAKSVRTKQEVQMATSLGIKIYFQLDETAEA